MGSTTRKKAAPAAGTHDLLCVALAKALKVTPNTIEAGMHPLRGHAVVAVDAFVKKGEKTTQSPAWPSREVLALALSATCGNDPAKLMRLLDFAARQVVQDHSEIPVELEVAMEAVKANHKRELEPLAREGATTVTGLVEILEFRER